MGPKFATVIIFAFSVELTKLPKTEFNFCSETKFARAASPNMAKQLLFTPALTESFGR